ncbi:hypothetical protein ABZT06_08680 [Streptomyces sp. NPDC005483]|uniref:hypothetical protein n=1 Tax=Streptomyces sp. NPDC005483 TaxID=3154882 RepID=UPI0033AB76FB
MTPDVYGAWMAAGNNLQTVGAWLAGDGAWVPIAAVAAVIVWRTWRIRPRDDYRSRNDQRQAAEATACAPHPEPGQPGTDTRLYLAAVAIYDDCEELDRLRDAIEQHRKETP